MKQPLFYLFCLVTLFSCSSKDKVPKSIIQPEKMEDVLWDVMRVQFLAEEKAAADSGINQEEELKELTDKVFDIHNVTGKKFDNSYNWYVKHPTFLKRIFDSMQVRKQKEFNGVEELPDTEELLDGTPVTGPPKGKKPVRRMKEMMEAIE